MSTLLILSKLTLAAGLAAPLAAQSRVAPCAELPHFDIALDPGVAERTATIEGVVHDDQGRPASGVVVFSSSGGQAATDDEGHYRLELLVPVEAQALTLTAVGHDQAVLRGTVQVPLSPVVADHQANPIELTSATGTEFDWLPTFQGHPGTDYVIEALAVFDDGRGSALYAGGAFSNAGGESAKCIARWDGREWSQLGGGMDQRVRTLAVYDDGSGPALYAGGEFLNAGGSPAKYIAKWDGSSWSAVGGGLNGFVHALAVVDLGSGPVLVVGGGFTLLGPPSSHSIATWNGSAWGKLGAGTDGTVQALATFDDGGGMALYAAGIFNKANGQPAKNIARWNGSNWSALGSGCNGPVEALATYDDGTGPALYAGGSFYEAGGVAANYVARWNGSNWAPLGAGANFYVDSFHVRHDTPQPVLLVGGRFKSVDGIRAIGVASWNGVEWSTYGTGITDRVYSFAEIDHGAGRELYAGGSIPTKPYEEWGMVGHISRLEGANWFSIGEGLDGHVNAVAVHEDATGPALYAGGRFGMAGGRSARRIAKWSDDHWEPLSDGLDGEVLALESYDDGGGPALFVGGQFSSADGLFTGPIAQWDGQAWAPVGGGLRAGHVSCLTVLGRGSNAKLVVGGDFYPRAYYPNHNIALWDGDTWMGVPGAPKGSPNDMVAFDDGEGPALYVAGYFAGNSILERWDGSNWSTMLTSVNDRVYSLTVFDDGKGPQLYAGGKFSSVNGVAANRIARWDGERWHPLGSGILGVGMGRVSANVADLAAGLGPDGPLLYAAGEFSIAGGMAARNIAAWDGTSWRSLGRGTSGHVQSLAVDPQDAGSTLYAGGSFKRVPDSGDSFVARWGLLR